jgi:hypothetical protein
MTANVGLASTFDFKNPDYLPVIEQRVKRLKKIRAGEIDLNKLKAYYRTDVAQFIEDWGMTFDPRNAALKRPTLIPFVLFPRQREWITWRMQCFADQADGLTDKSRELGVSWLSLTVDTACAVLMQGFVAGYGSRTEDEVDKANDPDCLFWKAREFIANLPPEFRGGWSRRGDAHLRISFPATGSTIKGDAGKNIGRGGRASVYTIDESAHVENPKAIDAALSQTTNCRQDISSVNGMANSFAERRHSGKIRVFTFHWRDDPRKDDAWYAKQNERLTPLIVAQEIDINYQASAQGVLIPGEWVQSAIDAHVKLGFAGSGMKRAGLDVADQGIDTCALAGRKGVLLDFLEEWSGKGSDTYKSVVRAVNTCEERGYEDFDYDGDGLGASVRGDVNALNDTRPDRSQHFKAYMFRGSEAVLHPDKFYVEKKTNADVFANRKAQAGFELRTRFMKTHRMIMGDAEYDFSELISIPSGLPLRNKLMVELTQPTYDTNGAGKYIIDKKPDEMASPNLYDCVMICYAKRKGIIAPTSEALARSRLPRGAPGRSRMRAMT